MLYSESEGSLQVVVLYLELVDVNFCSPKRRLRGVQTRGGGGGGSGSFTDNQTTFVFVSCQSDTTMSNSVPALFTGWDSPLLILPSCLLFWCGHTQEQQVAAGVSFRLVLKCQEMKGQWQPLVTDLRNCPSRFLSFLTLARAAFSGQKTFFIVWTGNWVSALSLYIWPSSEMFACLCEFISESMPDKWQMLPKILHPYPLSQVILHACK